MSNMVLRDASASKKQKRQMIFRILCWSIVRHGGAKSQALLRKCHLIVRRCLAGEGGLPRWKVSRKRWNIFVNLEQQLGSFCKNGPQRFWLTTAHIKSAGGVRRSWKLLPFEWSVPSNSLGIFVSLFIFIYVSCNFIIQPEGPARWER